MRSKCSIEDCPNKPWKHTADGYDLCGPHWMPKLRAEANALRYFARQDEARGYHDDADMNLQEALMIESELAGVDVSNGAGPH
jgi:hypothetical protein